MQVNHPRISDQHQHHLTQALHPKISVISCGPANGYGHPTQTAIDNLEAVDSNYIYQTEPGDAGAGTILAGRGVITNSNIWLLVNSTSVR